MRIARKDFDDKTVPLSNALAFTKRVVYFEGLRRVRNEKRHIAEPIDESRADQNWRDAFERVYCDDLRRRIVTAIENLPATQRKAITRLMDGWAVSEIAEVEGVPASTVRQRVCRGRARIRRALGTRLSSPEK